MKVESNKLLKIIFYILILLTLFLICPFRVSNSSAKTTYSIGLMTYDEVTMAGGLYSTKLTSPYIGFLIMQLI